MITVEPVAAADPVVQTLLQEWKPEKGLSTSGDRYVYVIAASETSQSRFWRATTPTGTGGISRTTAISGRRTSGRTSRPSM